MYKKKNLFFKKKNNTLGLISRRLSLVLKKRKNFKKIKPKKLDKGNFFLKKFFFKILLKNRKFFKKFFLFNEKVRQKRITKFIFKNKVYKHFPGNHSYEFTLVNTILRARTLFFFKDAVNFIKNNSVFVNGKIISDCNFVVSVNDCIQFIISSVYYKYLYFSRKILKKKLALYRFNNWKFFRQKYFKKKQNARLKKRKTPKWLYLFFLFRLNTPKTLEIDFLTLTIFVLKKENLFLQSTYYINKPFSFKLFSLYNFKKIN